MADPRYAKTGDVQNRVCEEAAEVIKEIMKAERFGLESSHPNQPAVTNRFRILQEIEDLRTVLDEYEEALRS